MLGLQGPEPRPGAAPSQPPSPVNWLGTDDRGRDVFARLLYGFRISIFFGLMLACLGTVLGILIGAMQGFFGGWLDLLGQRGIELWGSLPELYLLIILSATFEPSLPLLIVLLSIFGWMGLSAYVRAEFLRARTSTMSRQRALWASVTGRSSPSTFCRTR